jgi:hypothetical protein
LRVWRNYPDTSKRLLRLFPHFRYWKDLLMLITLAREDTEFHYNEDLAMEAMEVMRDQFLML